jgi:hypothetical protein
MSRRGAACAIGVAVAAGTLAWCAGASSMTPEKWHKDLTFLARDLPGRHADFFRRLDRARFERAVNGLDRRLPELQDHQVAVELSRLVAMASDGHTELALTQEATGFRRYPLLLYEFGAGLGDELRIVAAGGGLEGAVGGRVTRIGELATRAAAARVEPLLARDNDMEILHAGPAYLAIPEVLHALGIAPDMESLALTAALATGEERTVTVRPEGQPGTDPREWASARALGGASTPLYLQKTDENYWFTYLEDGRTLYCQYNRCTDGSDGPSIKAFAREMFAFADGHPVEKLVVDLRLNPGGNFRLSAPIVDGVRARPDLTGPDHLFVITGRRTFSAGMVTALLLERDAGATIAGEHSRGTPNGSANHEWFHLPNSRLQVDFTDQWHTPWPELGDAPYLPVDLEARVTFADYLAGRDPVLEAILGRP